MDGSSSVGILHEFNPSSYLNSHFWYPEKVRNLRPVPVWQGVVGSDLRLLHWFDTRTVTAGLKQAMAELNTQKIESKKWRLAMNHYPKECFPVPVCYIDF